MLKKLLAFSSFLVYNNSIYCFNSSLKIGISTSILGLVMELLLPFSYFFFKITSFINLCKA